MLELNVVLRQSANIRVGIDNPFFTKQMLVDRVVEATLF